MRKLTPKQMKRRSDRYHDGINELADAIGLYRTEDRATLKEMNRLAEEASVKGVNSKAFTKKFNKTSTYN